MQSHFQTLVRLHTEEVISFRDRTGRCLFRVRGRRESGRTRQKTKTAEVEKTLFTCGSCGAGSNVSTDPGDAKKDLRLLACLHSVCRDCLISSCVRADGLVACPSCMETTELPVIGWADALPRNYWFLRRAENQASPDNAEPECGECAEGETADKIVGVCVDCNELLCEVHWLAHQKGRRTKSHTLSKDTDMFSKSFNDTNATRRSTHVPCSVHTHYDVDSFCKTCNEMVCKVCRDQSHRHHDIDLEFLTNEVEVQRRDLEREMEQSNAGLERCEASIADLSARIDKVNLKAEAASKDVTTSVQHFVDDLRREEKLTLHHIDKARWSLQKELEEKLEQKKAAKDQLERARCLTQESLHGDGDRAQLLHVGETLLKNLEQGNSKCSSEVDLCTLPSPGAIHGESRTFHRRVQYLHDKLLSGSIIAAQPTDERCPIKFVESPFTDNQPSIHQISSQCAQVTDSSAYQSTAQAALEDPFGKVEPCDIFEATRTHNTGAEVNAATDISYACVAFKPKIPGEHKLHFTLNNQHVHGSPSLIQVKGYPFLSSSSRITAFAHERGKEPSYTRIKAEFGNACVKCGLFIPKVPTSAKKKQRTRAGVAVYAGEKRQNENALGPGNGAFYWQGDGKFLSLEQGEAGFHSEIKAEGGMHPWEDEDVMQLELSLVDTQVTLELTDVRRGTSFVAKRSLKNPIRRAQVLIECPNNYPVYILPAFY